MRVLTNYGEQRTCHLLILTRKLGDSILVGDDIEVVIKDIGKQHVRVGIVAPRHVTIRRRELGAGKTPPLAAAAEDDAPLTTSEP